MPWKCPAVHHPTPKPNNFPSTFHQSSWESKSNPPMPTPPFQGIIKGLRGSIIRFIRPYFLGGRFWGSTVPLDSHEIFPMPRIQTQLCGSTGIGFQDLLNIRPSASLGSKTCCFQIFHTQQMQGWTWRTTQPPWQFWKCVSWNPVIWKSDGWTWILRKNDQSITISCNIK